MKDDVLRRLAAARPEHLEPDRPVAVPEGELAAVMAGPRARRTLQQRMRRFVRPAWGIGLVGVTAAASLVVSSTVSAPGGGPGSSNAPGGPATTVSGRQILLAAAADVEKQAKGSGAYWYQEERIGWLQKVPGEDYTIDVRHDSRVWMAAGANKRWSQDLDPGARPATSADEAAWRAAGSPKQWDLTDYAQARRDLAREWKERGRDGEPPEPQPEIVTYQGRGEIEHDAPGGTADSGRMGEVPLKQLLTLPTDPVKLRDRLEKIVEEDYNAPKKVLHRLVIDTAVQIAISLPATPAQRAAAYRILADEPGVRPIGEVTDRAGRAGYAVAMPSRHGDGTEIRLIFDRPTGMPLGQETVATRNGDGLRKGRLVAYRTITVMKWTDEAPPFDSDFTASPDTGANGVDTEFPVEPAEKPHS
ncbi:CU044_5270 family protein [Streptomyces sp. PSKA54]|uniref:CU044_5270 family protein n=1 Tax=Streptomyces himalayensis subsp. aureolus TaxID=2758039 RepID=A0A7W2HEQ9_9ACTN|nr:CU044_5270 family protein [Streptomyces himalayensis]MBA4860864.1 CU044_5270 family protein [Streptomyces himalayensis subsp. aureolus]